MSSRLLGLGLIALLTTGCAMKYRDVDGRERRFFFLQRGIILQVTHTCTEVAQVYQAGSGLVATVRGGTPREIPLEPSIWGDQYITVTIQSIYPSGHQKTYIESFPIDYESTTSRAWLLSDQGYSGGWHVRHTRCQ